MYTTGDGSFLDDTNCVIQIQYVDLSGLRGRTPSLPLLKACERGFALETHNMLKLSQPKEFRSQGERLIQDSWEGRAEKSSESKHDQMDPAEREEIERQNRLLKQGYTRRTTRTTSTSSEWKRESIDFNGVWWIFCVSERISDEEKEAWRSTLDPAYDHVTEIYQPRKFAQALGLMAAEQLEIERDYTVMRSSVDGSHEVVRRFPVQQILHGPVLYSDEVYESILRQPPNAQMVYRAIFTKRRKYAAQREYRFAVFGRSITTLPTAYLDISARLREALEPPRKIFALGTISQEDNEDKSTAPVVDAQGSEQPDRSVLQPKRTVTSYHNESERKTGHQSQWITRDGDGNIIKAEIEIVSSQVKRYVTRCREADVDSIPLSVFDNKAAPEDADSSNPFMAVWISKDLEHVKVRWNRDISDTIDSITVEKFDSGSPDDTPPFSNAIPFSFDGRKTNSTDTRVPSLEDELAGSLRDPSFPRPPIEYWTERAGTPEDVAATYRVAEALSLAIEHVPRSGRLTAAAAGWHAIRCVRNLYAQFGPIVAAVWLEEQEIVTLQLVSAPFTRAQCRIWINPDGRYLVSVRNDGIMAEWKGGDEHGTLGLPTGHHVELLAKYGWHIRNRTG